MPPQSPENNVQSDRSNPESDQAKRTVYDRVKSAVDKFLLLELSPEEYERRFKYLNPELGKRMGELERSESDAKQTAAWHAGIGSSFETGRISMADLPGGRVEKLVNKVISDYLKQNDKTDDN